MKVTIKSLAQMIDSTLLKHDTPDHELQDLCAFAIDRDICSVCVYPGNMSIVYEYIEHTTVRLDAVAGFPFGTDSTKEKFRQAEERIMSGADEIDMVMNIGWFLEKRYKQVKSDINDVVAAAKNTPLRRHIIGTAIVKVIIESAALEDEEKRLKIPQENLIKDAAHIVADAGGDFVKTSTGMHKSGGVRENHVALIRSVIPPRVSVKAAGGIRTWEHTKKFLIEGAGRFGTSTAKDIITGFEAALENDGKDYIEFDSIQAG